MTGGESFDASHAEAEIERLGRTASTVDWQAPGGERFSLTIPPTVYPPRADTDFLASVLTPHRLPPKSRWLEVGCGSGALSLHAARLGCHITACDINPLAVACTRAHLAQNGLSGTVLEGGPGPLADGKASQWGGDKTYYVVIWNTPYLGVDALSEGALGPMEEAALTDTDRLGLFARMAQRIATTPLLSKHGIAYLTVSSRGVGQIACEIAWSHGVAARCIANTTFEDGEQLSVIAMWRPYADAPITHLQTTTSTNDDVLAFAGVAGATVRADEQTTGRGRRGRTWTTYPGAFLGSWLIHSGVGWSHSTRDQLRVGEALVRLLRTMSGRSAKDVCLKWPNDLFVRTNDGALKKAGGILFEAVSQGNAHHVLLGLGLNVQSVGAEHASIQDTDFTVDLDELHRMLHALVASLFEEVTHLPKNTPIDDAEGEVMNGISMLGPLFYRSEKVALTGLSASGALVFEGLLESVENPDELTWSGI